MFLQQKNSSRHVALPNTYFLIAKLAFVQNAPGSKVIFSAELHAKGRKVVGLSPALHHALSGGGVIVVVKSTPPQRLFAFWSWGLQWPRPVLRSKSAAPSPSWDYPNYYLTCKQAQKVPPCRLLCLPSVSSGYVLYFCSWKFCSTSHLVILPSLFFEK